MDETVYVVTKEDYEQSYVYCVAGSLDAAVKHLKKLYGKPEKVLWGEIEHQQWDDGEEQWTLRGHFKIGCTMAVGHAECFSIQKYPMIRG